MPERAIRRDKDALIVVDVQNDFCPGGALEVPEGDQVVAPANRVMKLFRHVVLTQDWHPRGHVSFASSHEGRKPMEKIELDYGEQTLWPDHCVPGTEGARFHPGLQTEAATLIVRKGWDPKIDSYSAFFENDHETPTGLEGYLRTQGIQRVFLLGLALDVCVGYSALDARRLDFPTVVLRDGARGIDVGGSLDRMLARMKEAGVEMGKTAELVD
ncbi:MAG: bifunctional nicotinamidase/pyrazinamidase [Candidatus Eisenbacteria bacterium]|nr:bifunctional nicotinamidase/pyrazinamidase [Candidatus Eisenbacteria bacterium]